MRLIDADALKEVLSSKDLITWTYEYGDAIPCDWIMSTIDNAPTVDCIEVERAKELIEEGYQKGHIDGVLQGEKLYAGKCLDKAPTIDISETIGSFRNTAYQNGLTTGLHKRTKCKWLYPYSDNVIGKRRVGKSIRVCSNCKESFNNNIPWNANFCPNCGAEVIKNER